MINENQLKEAITEIIRIELAIPPNVQLQETDLLQDDYGLDSIKFVKIIIALEEKFKFELEDEDLLITKFQTIHSITDIVKNRLQD